VEVFRRHPEGWVLQPVPDDGRLELLSLGFGRGLDAIYEDVALDGAYLAKDQAALP
jgi:Uma2 family endonuclease